MVRQAIVSILISGLWSTLAFAEVAKIGSTRQVAQVRILSDLSPEVTREIGLALENEYKTKMPTDLSIVWLNQGGSEANAIFIQNNLKRFKNTSGWDLVLSNDFEVMMNLQSTGALEDSVQLARMSKQLQGLHIDRRRLLHEQGAYLAFALEGFGILVNWQSLREQLTDLGSASKDLSLDALTLPAFRELIVVADPRTSSEMKEICYQLIRNFGWSEGMRLIEAIYTSSKVVTKSSARAAEMVDAGDVSLSVVSDLTAADFMGRSERPEMEYISQADTASYASLTMGQLKGAPRPREAGMVMQLLWGRKLQTVLQAARNTTGGPTKQTIGVVSVLQGMTKSRGNGRNIIPNPFVEAEGRHVWETPIPSSDMIAQVVGIAYVDRHADWRKIEGAGARMSGLSRREAWLASEFLPSSLQLKTLVAAWSQPDEKTRHMRDWRSGADRFFERRISRK